MQLQFPQAVLDLNVTRIMGVLNVTPDSFSDGGLYAAHGAAVERALTLAEEGADIIDIGGESTRPGAQPVGVAEELDRVIGVIEALRKSSDVPISVDTSKPEVMRAAIAAGASMVNDVCALAHADLTELADANVAVCLMHMQGEPRTMQTQPHYDDVVTEVREYLLKRAAACREAGISADRIVIDPGFGFGKTLEHNIALLHTLDDLAGGGYPLLVGLSRKSMIPALMANAGRSGAAAADAPAPPSERLGGSVTLAFYAAAKGAHIVRVHDVHETLEALTIRQSLDIAFQ